MSSPSILSPELIEKLQTSIDSNSEDYESFRSPIYSPSVFLQRQPSSIVANQQAISDEEFNHLLNELTLNDNFSMGLEIRRNRNDVNNSN